MSIWVARALFGQEQGPTLSFKTMRPKYCPTLREVYRTLCIISTHQGKRPSVKCTRRSCIYTSSKNLYPDLNPMNLIGQERYLALKVQTRCRSCSPPLKLSRHAQAAFPMLWVPRHVANVKCRNARLIGWPRWPQRPNWNPAHNERYCITNPVNFLWPSCGSLRNNTVSSSNVLPAIWDKGRCSLTSSNGDKMGVWGKT
jgi:hypothetical protein